MKKLRQAHENNKKVLEKNGFVITQYINTQYKQVLYAYHKDGRKVEISV